jgi:hypothetical protein
MPLEVQGVGAFREPFHEQVSTQSISCHGCTYQSKYEVIQGEVVFLEVRPPDHSAPQWSSRARVKWVQKAETKDRGFQIAVELEIAGNIWGIASPPDDWFPVRAPIVCDPPAPGRELRVVTRTEPQLAPAPDAESGGISHPERNAKAAVPLSSIAQLMSGLGEQIQVMASEAATSAFTKETSQFLVEFRVQLRDEATKAMQAVIQNSKEDLTRRALKELNEAYEAGARTRYAQWIKTIEQDMASARQHMIVQGKEVAQRLDGMATTTVERVQRNLETSRSEAVDRFVSRLREQVEPLLLQAKAAFQELTDTEAAYKKEFQSIYSGLESQLDSRANASLARAHGELDKRSAAVADKTTENLLKISQDFEKSAREHLQSLLVSLGNNMAKTLEDRKAEISREFSMGLEEYTRSYLEFIARSMAEIPRNAPGHSGD